MLKIKKRYEYPGNTGQKYCASLSGIRRFLRACISLIRILRNTGPYYKMNRAKLNRYDILQQLSHDCLH